VVLPHRHIPTHPVLLSRASLSSLILALREHPIDFVRSRLCTANEWDQFYVHGPCRIHLPVVREAVPLPLVATIQLSSLGGAGCWGHHRPFRHILFAANEVGRRCQGELVGEFRMEEYCRRAVGPPKDTRNR